MRYPFPSISHINHVAPLVQGRSDYSIVEKDDHIIICYNLMGAETFPPIKRGEDTILRECRGITFDKTTGYIISRKYHKFFNVNEREETLFDNIDFSRPHKVLEKLDGSMIVPVQHGNGAIRWHTKRGLSDTAMRAEVFVAKNPNYFNFAKTLLEKRISPIFEWCSPKDQIVLSYPEETLILTAMRVMISGEYFSYDAMTEGANLFSIPVVKAYDPAQFSNPQKLMEAVGAAENDEGVVLRFDDGHMLKVKSDWYCQLHRAVGGLAWEYNIIQIILDEKTDDLMAVLRTHGHPLADSLDSYVKEFHKIVKQYSDLVRVQFDTTLDDVSHIEDSREKRKAFAAYVNSNFKSNPIKKALFFKALDGHNVNDVLLDLIRSNSVNNSKWQRFKEITPFSRLVWKMRG